MEASYPSGDISATTGEAKPRVLLAVGRLDALATVSGATGLWTGAAALAIALPAAVVMALLTWLRRKQVREGMDLREGSH